MSKAFTTPSVPGRSTIDEEVIKQIKYREAVMSNSSENAPSELDPNDRQSLIHGSSPYFRITSGVVDEEDGSTKITLGSGGASDEFQGHRQGIEPEAKLFTEHYSLYTIDDAKYGITPTPMVSNLSISQHGGQVPGAILIGEFDIKCFNKAQFDYLEKYFSRPGFQLLLEWGHGMKINKAGKFDTTLNLVSESTTDEQSTDSSNTTFKIKEEASQLREDSGFNYDYLMGTITNYSWKYEASSYNINVRVMGKGSVSLAVQQLLAPPETITAEEKDEAEKFKSNFGQFYEILDAVDKAAIKASTPKRDRTKPKLETIDKAKFEAKLKSKDMFNALEENAGDMDMYQIRFRSRDNRQFSYIKYKHLLGLINLQFVERQGGEDAGKGDTSFGLTEKEQLYATYPDHFSYDPAICLIGGVTDSDGVIDTTAASKGEGTDQQGDILELLLRVGWLKDLYESEQKLSTNPDFGTLGSYLTKINREVVRSLGYVNDLSIILDPDVKPELGPSRIVDSNCPPDIEGGVDIDKIMLIQPQGLGSTVTSLSINSELNANLINLITAGTIANDGDAAKNTQVGLSAFNKGLTHKWKGPKKSTTGDAKKEDAPEEEENPLVTLEKAYGRGHYPSEAISSTTSEFTSLIKKQIDEADASQGSTGMRGPVGGKLTATMKGISGMKMLQYFTIPKEFLPTTWYLGDIVVGFRIGNISHEIGAQWTTTVEGQAIVLKGKF
tara:strand:+ start:2127 stop:4298 length:2172 start_codon:yes stop_codon:yes gene_type:complete